MSQTLAQWQERLKAAGFRVRCPVCGHVATPNDFKKLGVDPQRAAQECIGRHIPNSRKAFAETGQGPCDYATYGLLQLGEKVLRDGEEIWVMPVSEEVPA